MIAYNAMDSINVVERNTYIIFLSAVMLFIFLLAIYKFCRVFFVLFSGQLDNVFATVGYDVSAF
jgi:hypothetical protein